ncbi:DUF1761 domain-containing protein [Qipengyuania psychrotolerans]|jgi:hypothetical protein|uniref:DUF1761 domain-containing protein n=1 Tax=Qipengyuania psychrotolerans TaxID=2867238 RepID=A0ABX8ZEY0_9SPHN|nr:DUF1761 domain-containing protein [Qipengyuania psychrotolerans]QZD87545.1 DUF1761 domain-containing protein [Qipengyuania psychrotolerans]
MDIFAVNWLAVVLAALAGFLVGGIWYGPLMGKSWMVAMGKTEDDLKNINPAKLYGFTFLLAILASWTLAHTFASYAKDLSTVVKVMTAFGVALGFIVPALWTNYLFQDAKKPLFWIDAGYWLLFYIAMGLVHALMS